MLASQNCDVGRLASAATQTQGCPGGQQEAWANVAHGGQEATGPVHACGACASAPWPLPNPAANSPGAAERQAPG